MKTIWISMFMISLLVLTAFSAQAATLNDLSTMTSMTVSLVNQDPDPAIAGNIIEIRLGIENRGGEPVNDLVIALEPEYPFGMVPGEDEAIYVGTINGYQDDENIKIVKFRIIVDQDAPAGRYELATSYYEKGSSVRTKQDIGIDVKNQENAEVIHIDKTVLVPGAESSLKFTINNVGNAPLRDLTFRWENEDEVILPVGSDNTKYIKQVDMGKSVTMEYTVIADSNADPGLYVLDLSLTYDDPISGSASQVSTIAGIYVGGGTDFDVAFSESSAGETSFSIANIGSNPAYSVSVMIPDQRGWSVSGSNSVIIGNLNKGDYTVASFSLQNTASANTLDGTIQPNPDRTNRIPREDMTEGEMQARRDAMNRTSGDDTITITVAYTDTRGERKKVDKEVKVASSGGSSTASAGRIPNGATRMPGTQNQGFWSQYKWYIIIGVVVIGGFIYYRKRRTKKILEMAITAKKSK
ncbi:MAG: COG1361 S-layer family protein [archaeon]